MPNPIFLVTILLTLVCSFYSLTNWKLGLLVFFVYTQFFGIIKRIILSLGLDNFSYNVLVVSQYIFLLSIIMGVLRDPSKPVKSNGRVRVWVMLFLLALFISILISPYGLGISLSLSVIQYFPIFIIIIGQYLEPRQIEDLKTLFIRTAPIHALYQIYQFFFGPFGFELSFIDTKYSVITAFQDDFMRGIPLYDSVDPLYLHFALVFLLLLKGRKNFYSYLNMFLIIIALIVIGNRSGLILLFLATFIWLLLEWKIPRRKFVLAAFTLLIVTSLNIFGYLLLDVIRSVESINISQSDFGARLGSLGTYTERIIGRQKASDHLTVFGMGLGSSGLAVSTLANKGLNYEASNNDFYAHDLVGEIMLDFGIVGLVLFSVLIWNLLKYSINIRDDTPFLAMILSSFLTSSLLGGSFTYGRAGYFVFLFVGYLFNKIKVLNKHQVIPHYA